MRGIPGLVFLVMHPCSPFYPAELDKVQKLRATEQGRQGGKPKRKWKLTTACLQLNSIQERLQGKEGKNWDFSNWFEAQQSMTSYDCGQVTLPL